MGPRCFECITLIIARGYERSTIASQRWSETYISGKFCGAGRWSDLAEEC